MLVPMTLSDLERQNARSQIFLEDLCNFACTVWHRMTTFGQVRHGEGHFYAGSATSSSWGGMLEEHSHFHDASPGRTIRCSPQCRVKSKVERFEIAVDCPKPGLTRSASWAAPINREAIGGLDACSAREWSSEAAARAICPNCLRRCCCISRPHPLQKVQRFFIESHVVTNNIHGDFIVLYIIMPLPP